MTSPIYLKGTKYTLQWRSVFFDSLHLSPAKHAPHEKLMIGEIAVQDCPILFSMPDKLQPSVDYAYHIIDPGTTIDQKYNNESDVYIVNQDGIVAADSFDDSIFDVLYIGKMFGYKDAMKMLDSWFSKVKPGGWLAGNGYSYDESPRAKNKDITDAVKDFAHCLQEQGTGKLDTRWIRYQSEKLPVPTNGIWRIKRITERDGI